MSDERGTKTTPDALAAPATDASSNTTSTKSDAAAGSAVSAGQMPTESASAAPSPRDLLYVRGPSEDGAGIDVVRVTGDEVSAGQLRAVKDGQPIRGELVKLSPRADSERLFDVETLAKPSELGSRGKGPAKVASDAYRDGWDNIFGARKPSDVN